jgi:hypothetical protein
MRTPAKIKEPTKGEPAARRAALQTWMVLPLIETLLTAPPIAGVGVTVGHSEIPT